MDVIAEQVTSAPKAARRRRNELESLSTLRVPMWIAVAYVLLTSNADPDLFGHLRFGLDHLQTWHLSATDPYSFTSDLPWTNHEWLSELTMAVSYSLAGAFGLVLMKGLVTVATLLLITGAVKNAEPLWRWPSGLLAVLGMLPISLTIRPQIWTLLFLTLTCSVLVGAWKHRFWLPPIFLLWANLHGGWLVGIGVLVVWSAVELFEQAEHRPPFAVLFAVPAACLLATLVNPYGWHLWEFLASTVRMTRADIAEWQPLFRAGTTGSVIHWIAAVVWAGLAIKFSERRSLKAIAASAILAYSSMRVLRLVPLFIPSVVILLTPYIRKTGSQITPVWSRAKTAIDLAFAGIGLVVVAWPMSPGCVHMTGSWLPDSSAARAISAANLSGRMVSWFDWGEYAIWHFGPRLRVSIDGRRETVYSEAVLEEQRKIAFGEPDALTRMQTIAPEYAWLPQGHTDRAKPWLASHGYRIDIDTPTSFVAVRADLPRLPPATEGAAPCFPGP